MTDTFAKQLDELRYYLDETVAVLLCNAADRVETLEAALREIADGPRNVEKSYISLLREIRSKARAALEEKTDDSNNSA